MFTRKSDDTTYFDVTKTDEEWKKELSPERYAGPAAGRNRAGLVRRPAPRRRGRCVSLCRVRRRAVRHRLEVRLGFGLAKLRPGPRRKGRSSRSPTVAFSWCAPRSSAPGAAATSGMCFPTGRPTPACATASTRSPSPTSPRARKASDSATADLECSSQHGSIRRRNEPEARRDPVGSASRSRPTDPAHRV